MPTDLNDDIPERGLQIVVVRYPDGLSKWHYVNDYLKLRKTVFIDRLDWPLFHSSEVEFEQYDTFDTTYIIAVEDGVVVGGARLRRTDQRSGAGTLKYSYMIRDACLGLLPGLPDTLCTQTPPLDSDVWELTRMVVAGSSDVTRKLLDATNAFLADQGARSVLFLGSPAFQRMARSFDWPAKTLGPVTGNEDGRFQVFECPVSESGFGKLSAARHTVE